nr:DUF2513 domain-containing protein [uncultured Amphritea sp.]
MKRDMELVRAILTVLEEHPHGFAPSVVKLEGYTEDAIGFHCHIMAEAGLITGRAVTSLASTSPSLEPKVLTWEGYEFLENTKNPELWQQTKDMINGLGGASFSVWSSVAAKVVMKNLGLDV